MRLRNVTIRRAWQWLLRIVLSAACIAMLAFIFSNSLKTGEQSSQQSSTVVKVVQDVASVVAPNSAVAKATGEAYERLHTWVRMVAHFFEFAFFGGLLLWCIASYTWREAGLWCALGGVCLVPMIDESLQYFVAGRGAEFFDVCTDVAGGICGILFALVVLLFIVGAQDKRQSKRRRKQEALPARNA